MKSEVTQIEAARNPRPILVVFLLTAITLVAAWLRLHYYARHGLWLDEAATVLFAHKHAGRFWHLMWEREGNMVLYYLLMRAWVHVGNTEFVVRLPSVLFAVASIPMIYVLGRDLFSRTTGLIAAALLCVNWFHIFFSQEARSYTLLIFLLLLAAWLFLRFTEFPDRKLYRYSYPVVSALAMYAHVFAVLVVAAHWISLGPRRAREIGWTRLLRVIATFILLALPIEAFTLLRNEGQLNWIPRASLRSLVDAVSGMAGFNNGQFLVLAFGLGLAALGVIASYMSRYEKRKFSAQFTLSWLIVPIAVFLLYSIHRPLFFSRYLIICTPALLLLVAEGVDVIKQAASSARWLWLPATAVLLLMSVRATVNYYKAPMWPDWNAATKLVLANQRPGDGVCFTANGVEPFLYYLQRNTDMAWDSLPGVQIIDGHRCIVELPGTAADRTGGQRRLWLITADATPQQEDSTEQAFVPRYGRPIPRGTFNGMIKVELLSGAGS